MTRSDTVIATFVAVFLALLLLIIVGSTVASHVENELRRAGPTLRAPDATRWVANDAVESLRCRCE